MKSKGKYAGPLKEIPENYGTSNDSIINHLGCPMHHFQIALRHMILLLMQTGALMPALARHMILYLYEEYGTFKRPS